jgi:hypothetical protein
VDLLFSLLESARLNILKIRIGFCSNAAYQLAMIKLRVEAVKTNEDQRWS